MPDLWTIGYERLPPDALVAELEAADEPSCPPWLARALQAMPSSYLRYYYRTAAVVAAQGTRPSRAAQVIEIEGQLLQRYSDPALTTMPEELMKRGGAYYSTAAVNLMLALGRCEGEVHIVNTRVGDAVPGWPAHWVAELPCCVSCSGVHPLAAQPLPPLAEGLLQAVKSYELLTAEAALSGSVDCALQALAAHPLGPGAERAPAFWEDLLATHAQYLPNFRGAHGQ